MLGERTNRSVPGGQAMRLMSPFGDSSPTPKAYDRFVNRVSR